MVKRLRRCPLTAESAVRFRMGLPKKYSTTLCGAVFFCMPLSGNDAATCCRRSSICASKFLPRNSVLRKSKISERACKRKRQLPHGATYFFGARNDAATCLPSFVFASANFAVVLRFTEVEKIRKGMQTETATSAWGYTTSVRETTRPLHFYMIKDFPD